MNVSVAIRIRVLAAAALAGLAAATGMLAFGMGPFGAASSAPPAADVSPSTHRAAKATGTNRTTLTRTQARAKPAAPVDEAPAPAAAVETVASRLPTPIADALALHEVVVVSLVSPTASVDALALREARAGASLAGAGFVRIPVVSQSDMKKLTAVADLRHTPAVLVFTRPDRLFLQVKGFADRQTVAQAAKNAPA